MRFLITIFALLFTTTVFAQNRVGINEVQMSTSQGDQPAFEFFIPDTDAKAVLSAWNEFHKNLKTKPKQDKDQRNYYFSDDASLEDLSENTIDIYTRIYETSGGVRFTCAFDLGGVFISSDKTVDKFNKTKLLLNKFYAQIAMDAIIEEIEREMVALEEIRKEYDALEKEIDAFEEEVTVYEEKIDEQSEEQAIIESELLSKTAELEKQSKDLAEKKNELNSINKVAMVTDLTDNINSLKKTDLELVKIEKDIERKEAEIKSIEAEIDILKNNQIDKTQDKLAFEAKIKAIEDKLEALNIDEKEENVKLLEKDVANIEATQSDLSLKKKSTSRAIQQQQLKLEKVQEAIKISRETKAILEHKMKVQEEKLKSLEDLKATIE